MNKRLPFQVNPNSSKSNHPIPHLPIKAQYDDSCINCSVVFLDDLLLVTKMSNAFVANPKFTECTGSCVVVEKTETKPKLKTQNLRLDLQAIHCRCPLGVRPQQNCRGRKGGSRQKVLLLTNASFVYKSTAGHGATTMCIR